MSKKEGSDFVDQGSQGMALVLEALAACSEAKYDYLFCSRWGR